MAERRKPRTGAGSRLSRLSPASRGLRPFADARTRVLVVGTLPGQASLAARQYYAQPRNAFWRIIEDLYAVARALPYEQRIAGLLQNGLGLWDVCASAHRPGSLDSSIERESIVPNDFRRFFRRYPGIALLCFNGRTAAGLYSRLVSVVADETARPRMVTLPSTSPAHASMTYAVKLDRWRRALDENAE